MCIVFLLGCFRVKSGGARVRTRRHARTYALAARHRARTHALCLHLCLCWCLCQRTRLTVLVKSMPVPIDVPAKAAKASLQRSWWHRIQLHVPRRAFRAQPRRGLKGPARECTVVCLRWRVCTVSWWMSCRDVSMCTWCLRCLGEGAVVM